jgi:hypothetical protein
MMLSISARSPWLRVEVEGADAFLEVGRGARADDGDLDGRVGQHPGHRELGDGGAAVGGEAAQRRDDFEIAQEPGPGEGRAVRPPVIATERGGFGDGAAEQPVGQRPVGSTPMWRACAYGSRPASMSRRNR